MKIDYIGKCVMIESNGEKAVVIGDLHLGYENSMKIGGIDIGGKIYEDLIAELEKIIGKAGRPDKIILLGDVKHEFSELTDGERNYLSKLFDYLSGKCGEIVIIKGNHDNYLLNISSKKMIKVFDYYLWNEYCFLHGDRDFEEIYEKDIKYWVMGHMHPAIKISEGAKIEKYKCFLEGEYKGKKIIILPSFSDVNERIDVREISRSMPWKFDLKNFNVKVVGENLESYDFGKLKEIK